MAGDDDLPCPQGARRSARPDPTSRIVVLLRGEQSLPIHRPGTLRLRARPAGLIRYACWLPCRS
jgi:hypothetical protein